MRDPWYLRWLTGTPRTDSPRDPGDSPPQGRPSFLEPALAELESLSLNPFLLGEKTREILRREFLVRDTFLCLKSDAVDPLLHEQNVIDTSQLLSGDQLCLECPVETGAMHIIADFRPSLMKEVCLIGGSLGDTVICLPVRFSGKFVGALVMLRDREPALSPSDTDTLNTLGALLSVAVERRLLHELNKIIEVTDPLTRLHNYRYFQNVLGMELDRSRRYNHPFSLIMADIDRFRQVNERHGHEIGNTLLRDLSARLKRCIRSTDTIVRYAGEEFMFVLPETGRKGAAIAAEKIRRSIVEAPFPHPESREPIRLSISVGIAVYPDDANIAGGLINAVETALYRAKRDGGNRVKTLQDT